MSSLPVAIRPKSWLLLGSMLLPLALPATARAQDATDEEVEPAPAPDARAGTLRSGAINDDDFHRNDGIVVTAPYVQGLDILSGVSELSGDRLTRELRGQIGDTLLKIPGVSATSFAPGVSRPVLRGFQGERVRVMTDGLGSIDASNTSADHAVALDTLTIERIEVLRGPAVLLFGGQAVGGAVNAIDKRIPREIPTEPIHVDALAGFASAADEYSVAGSIDVPIGARFVAHVDASYRNSDDQRVGGYVLSPGLRAEQLAIAAEEREEGHIDEAEEAEGLAALRGRIPNTGTESTSLGAGVAFIDDGGSLGVSVSWLDSNYGVPARPGVEHAHNEGEEGEEEGHAEEGPVTIGLEQLRVDFRGEVKIGGFFDALRLRAAYADYEHIEFEGDEIGTRFLNTGIEGRAELVQSENAIGGDATWRGASGVQFVSRDFEAIGAEAFVPPTLTTQFGVFTLQELQFGPLGVEVSGRYDHSEIDANTIGLSRSFSAWSGAFGLSYAVTPDIKIGANLARTERAPSAEELFSDGPHIATQAYEIGNPDFTTERNFGGELYLRYDGGPVRFAVTGFYNDFSNFIVDLPTALEEDGLPVFQYVQTDAEYYGVEFEGSAKVFELGDFDLIADGVADYVHATLTGGNGVAQGAVPRIPPLRLLGGLELQRDDLDLRGEVEWFDGQDRVTEFETPTPGFTLVNASASWKPFGSGGGLTLIASANNIFDTVGRRHASFTKDFVPIAGRDFRITAKLSF